MNANTKTKALLKLKMCTFEIEYIKKDQETKEIDNVSTKSDDLYGNLRRLDYEKSGIFYGLLKKKFYEDKVIFTYRPFCGN